jgi:hypothetical protein
LRIAVTFAMVLMFSVRPDVPVGKSGPLQHNKPESKRFFLSCCVDLILKPKTTPQSLKSLS